MEELEDDIYNEVLRLSKIGNTNYKEGGASGLFFSYNNLK